MQHEGEGEGCEGLHEGCGNQGRAMHTRETRKPYHRQHCSVARWVGQVPGGPTEVCFRSSEFSVSDPAMMSHIRDAGWAIMSLMQ